jgi:hypothetical protein
MSEETKGNSEARSNADDSKTFFNQLEGSVNGMVSEGEVNSNTEVTQSESGSEQVTHNGSQGSNLDWDNENNPYKKRYTDSSREAVRMNQQLSQLKPFVPVLNAMKQDSGLVEHVREYLQSGGKPDKNVKQQLDLPEDFEYDANEAVENPDSDSAKVMNAQIDKVVNERVGQVLNKEKKNSAAMQKKIMQRKGEIDFIKKHKLSKEQFLDFRKEAQSRRLSLDDIYYLLNKDRSNQNIANSTKKDMLNQMRNVRDIPTSASDSNSQGVAHKSPSDSVFDSMLDVDSGLDELFG